MKIIKHNPEQTLCEENGDDEDDHLPPPSPPPGSPPPHIFPPRIKTIISNMQAYIPNVLGNQNQPVYTPTMNQLMATQTLSRLQQFNIPGGQSHVPPLPESSHMPVHQLAHYPLSSVVAPPPPPVVTSGSYNILNLIKNIVETFFFVQVQIIIKKTFVLAAILAHL